MAETYRAFLSSTYDDLKEHRAHVISRLRACGILIDPMEEWQADPAEPKTFSAQALEGCDLCILLVSFHRGHVPPGERESITQLEYQAATRLGIDVMVFVLDEDEPWPPNFDSRADPAVRAWRASFRDSHGVLSFRAQPSSIDIEPSLVRWVVGKSKAPAAPMSTPRLDSEPLTAQDLAQLSDIASGLVGSLVPQIKNDLKLILAGNSASVPVVDLKDGRAWWSTRLFLLASLLRDFTDVRLLAFTDARGYVGVATPARTARALGSLIPEPSTHYRREDDAPRSLPAAARALARFTESFGPDGEAAVKRWMNGDSIREVLGDALTSASLFVDGDIEPTSLAFLHDVVAQREDDVAILKRDGGVLSVIDRRGLADRLALDRVRP